MELSESGLAFDVYETGTSALRRTPPRARCLEKWNKNRFVLFISHIYRNAVEKMHRVVKFRTGTSVRRDIIPAISRKTRCLVLLFSAL